MKRLALSSAFLVLFGVSAWVTLGEAQPGGIQQIADGVWFRTGERSQGHCNNVLIEMADGLLVVDANFPSGAELVMRDAKRLSSKPVKWVFDTHHHGDHAYANSVWTKAGAKTFAYIGVAEEIRRYEPTRWLQASKDREDVRRLGLKTLEPPQETFSESPYVMEDATRRVEFHHFGWAHTRGDSFAYLPKEKILCSGDAVVNGPFNYTGDGNTGNWPSVMRALRAKLDVERVLPGHGGPGGGELIDGQMAFFEAISGEVEAARKAGKKLEDIVTLKEGAGIATTVKLPDTVQNWVGDSFAEQVRVRWAELAEGKPHGEILVGE